MSDSFKGISSPMYRGIGTLRLRLGISLESVFIGPELISEESDSPEMVNRRPYNPASQH